MKQYQSLLTMLVCMLGICTQTTSAQDHDRFVTLPVEHAREFTAFVLSFDGLADNVALGVPVWVAYELAKTPSDLGPSRARPRKWTTDPDLFAAGIAPNDDSYRGSGYSRGHMAMKSHAGRMGSTADRETFTVLNACPQMQSMNAGVWLSLETATGYWADMYDRVWIVCGPVYYTNHHKTWIGDEGEVPVAVPDAFFKIVIKDAEQPGRIDVLAFLVPMYGDGDHSKRNANITPYLTSIDTIEALTGIDFLTAIEDSTESEIEMKIFTRLWPTTHGKDFVSQSVSIAPESAVPKKQDRQLGEGPHGLQPTPADAELARIIIEAGWTYTMPEPKSRTAAWDNKNANTTWWPGYWRNINTNKYSRRQPSKQYGFTGDGIYDSKWRRGGPPSLLPSDIEWLCSTGGGPPR